MGRDKATLPHPDGDTTMVEYTVATLSSRCAPVFVIAAPVRRFPRSTGRSCVTRSAVSGRSWPPVAG